LGQFVSRRAYERRWRDEPIHREIRPDTRANRTRPTSSSNACSLYSCMRLPRRLLKSQSRPQAVGWVISIYLGKASQYPADQSSMSWLNRCVEFPPVDPSVDPRVDFDSAWRTGMSLCAQMENVECEYMYSLSFSRPDGPSISAQGVRKWEGSRSRVEVSGRVTPPHPTPTHLFCNPPHFYWGLCVQPQSAERHKSDSCRSTAGEDQQGLRVCGLEGRRLMQ
jgi:hypothetical protein